jgi:hypothetical protein
MKKYTIITIMVFIIALSCSVFAQGYRFFEIKSPAFEAESSKEAIILYKLTNYSDSSYSCQLPYEWYGRVWVWFHAFLNEQELKYPLGFQDWGYRYRTTLGPYESVTIAFYLSTVAKVQREDTSPIGRFEIIPTWKTDAIGDPIICTKPLIFYAVEPGKIKSLTMEEIKSKEDEEKADAMIGLNTLSSYDRLSLIKLAISSNKKDLLWRLIVKSDDCFAIVSALMEMPVELLDKEALLKLLLNKDLSIRREAIRALGKLGKDSSVAEKLSKFLSTQKDQVTLEYGKATLKALQDE